MTHYDAILDLASAQYSVLFGNHNSDSPDKKYVKTMRSSMVEAAPKELGPSLPLCNVPNSHNLHNVIRNIPLDWNPFELYTCAPQQSESLYNEQHFVIKIPSP